VRGGEERSRKKKGGKRKDNRRHFDSIEHGCYFLEETNHGNQAPELLIAEGEGGGIGGKKGQQQQRGGKEKIRQI